MGADNGAAPAFILVEPQMGENIGAAARAMANFALSDLRVVNPRDGWPNPQAEAMAKHASYILQGAKCTSTLDAALEGCGVVYAVTARMREVALPVLPLKAAAADAAAYAKAGVRAAFMFGRERDGLTNDEVSRASAIVTIPVSPAYPSLNLAQAAGVCAYEYFAEASAGALCDPPPTDAPAPHEELEGYIRFLEHALERAGFFRTEEKKEATRLKLRAYLRRSRPSSHEVGLLYGMARMLQKR